MSSEERRKILQMVADGKISAEEAANLMRAMDDDSEETDSAEPEVIQFGPASSGERSEAPELDEVRRRAMRFSSAFLWIGILVTVFTAWWMYSVMQGGGINFWFICLTMPLTLGIMLIALGASSRTSRWLYVNVDRSRSKDQDGPRRISLAFPLPLGFAAWFIRTFGSRIDKFKDTNLDDVVSAIAMAKNITDPLIVHVDDADDGERVQVFIG